jgi:UDP-glucose 4-epimerase
MRVLVTGGAGFIGANLCRALLAHPGVSSVTALDDLSTGRLENLDGADASLVQGSILDVDLLAKLVFEVDTVVHLAARPSVPKSLLDPSASHEVNATGTLRVLEAARAHGCHTIVASSSSVYGATEGLPKREDMPARPMSPYGVSKLATEAYSLAYQSSFDLPTLTFRFFNVYGPLQPADHDYAAVVPSFIARALAGQPVRIYGDGLQTRDFTFVGSVTEVIGAAVLRRLSHDAPVNLAFGTRCTLLDLVATLEEVLERKIEIEFEPTRRGDIRDSQASQEVLRSLFPDATPVGLAEGLARTVDWFVQSRRWNT